MLLHFLNFVFVVALFFGNVNSVEWTKFSVKFGQNYTGEWVIPLTVEEAKKDYVQAGYHEQFTEIAIYCMSADPQACPMYDVCGRLCGFRVTYIIKDLDLKSQGKLSYQYDTIACFKKGKVFEKPAYYTDILFTSPEKLLEGGLTDRSEPLGDSLWFKLDDKPWTEIPREESKIVKMPGVVKQNCYPRMGQHYFFNFDKTTPCDTAFPFFTMYDGGKLVGVGLVSFGTFTSKKRVWYENIPDTFVPMIFRSAPDCLAAGIRQFGGIGLHMYMTNHPELIKCASNTMLWDNMKVKYSPPFSGKYPIPLTVSKIGKEFDFLHAHEDFPLVSLYAYPGDPRVQLMYDDHGNICGIRVAYVKDQIPKRTPKGETFPYSYKKPIFTERTISGIGDCYTIDVIFIHPDVLKTGGPASRKEAVGTGVYIKMDGVNWTEMPRKEKDTVNTKFTKQACFLGMGQHYFYNMTETMRCEDHNPVFLLYVKGELIGIGLIPFGTFDPKFGRPWFEDPPQWVIKTIVPHSPECLSQWVGKYGTTSLHIYFRHFNELNCIV